MRATQPNTATGKHFCFFITHLCAIGKHSETEIRDKMLGKTRKIALFSGKSGKCCPFRKFKLEWKSPFVFIAENIFLVGFIITIIGEHSTPLCVSHSISLPLRVALTFSDLKTRNKARSYSRHSVAEWLGRRRRSRVEASLCFSVEPGLLSASWDL